MYKIFNYNIYIYITIYTHILSANYKIRIVQMRKTSENISNIL